ncbi:hypothetical protein [Streptomyces sp. MBT28]|uniref:hypothetical protein n=1 Tax=Streptomyces sp. MBT28 TaxID=1488357 RepID=UPI0006196B6A|nr:hypothetical protein [Streptomyces sp. MBT28]
MARKKPRSPGVSLGNRAAGLHRYTDEIAWEGGKDKARRRVRANTRRETRTIVADELTDRDAAC